jgi:hypothetical protein
MKKKPTICTYVLERVVECHFPKLRLDDQDSLTIRVEILRNAARKTQFFARVNRLDTNRVQPTFPQVGGKPKHKLSDETFWVQDHFLWLPDACFFSKSAEAAISHVLAKIVGKLM